MYAVKLTNFLNAIEIMGEYGGISLGEARALKRILIKRGAAVEISKKIIIHTETYKQDTKGGL